MVFDYGCGVFDGDFFYEFLSQELNRFPIQQHLVQTYQLFLLLNPKLKTSRSFISEKDYSLCPEAR